MSGAIIKKTICITVILVSCIMHSQSSRDYLVTREKDTIFCKIIGLSGKMIEFIAEKEKSSTTDYIYNFLDAKISDMGIIENPLGIKIEQPEKGYAYVYLYRPYVYTGAALNCKVEYNDTSLVNLKSRSYYLHKVKANEKHRYKWNNGSSRKAVEIDAKEGEVYYIRGSFVAEYQPWNTFAPMSNGMSIFLDNPKIARYMVLTMKKESLPY